MRIQKLSTTNYHRPQFTSKLPKIPNVISHELKNLQEGLKTYSVKDILKTLNVKPEELPKHITPTISPRSGQIVGLNLTTKEGNVLRISRKMSSEYGSNLTYLSFTEIEKSGKKKYLNIDIKSNDFLRTNPFGKPVVDETEGILYSYTKEEAVSKGIQAQFDRYMGELFDTNTGSHTVIAPEAYGIKIKDSKSSKPKIDDIRVEDFEDRNLTKMIDRENHSRID